MPDGTTHHVAASSLRVCVHVMYIIVKWELEQSTRARAHTCAHSLSPISIHVRVSQQRAQPRRRASLITHLSRCISRYISHRISLYLQHETLGSFACERAFVESSREYLNYPSPQSHSSPASTIPLPHVAARPSGKYTHKCICVSRIMYASISLPACT